jgi:predicted metalloprotease with PDZ domain
MYRYLLTTAALAILAAWALPLGAQTEDSQQQQSSQRSGARPYLGVTIESSAREGQGQGLTIAAVTPNSPASRAGLRVGDTITAVNNHSVRDFEDLQNVLSRHHAGEKLNFKVMQNGQEKTLPVTLRPRPAGYAQRGQESAEEEEQGQTGGAAQGRYGQENEEESGRSQRRQGRLDQEEQQQPGRFGQFNQGRGAAFLGVQARPLTPQLRSQRGIEAEEGVLVTEVVPGSPAEQAGLRAGDVISRVNNEEINSPEDLRRAVRQAGVGRRLRMEIQRGNQERQVTARLEGSPVEFSMPGQRSYGQFSEEDQTGQGSQSPEIRRLERRIQQLERRIRELEQNQNSSRGSPR